MLKWTWGWAVAALQLQIKPKEIKCFKTVLGALIKKKKKKKQVCFRSSKGTSDTSAPRGSARFFIVLGEKIHDPLVSQTWSFPWCFYMLPLSDRTPRLCHRSSAVYPLQNKTNMSSYLTGKEEKKITFFYDAQIWSLLSCFSVQRHHWVMPSVHQKMIFNNWWH